MKNEVFFNLYRFKLTIFTEMTDKTRQDKTRRSNSKNIVFSIILIFVCFFLTVAIGELVCRLIGNQPFKKHTPHAPYDTAQKDDYLGWKMTPNYTFSGEIKDDKDKPYSLSLQYDENGFKTYGNPKSDKQKVFFIGDSYTACIEVSNEKSFFNLIKDSIDIEVFAYGHAGYSTLQQWMVLEKYLPIIEPDLVVWQTCSNDWIDNYAPLEMESGYKVGERRPYMTADGTIIYERPVTTLKKLAEYSSFMHFLYQKWQNISYNYLEKDKKVAEYWIAHEKQAYEPYAASIRLTNILFEKVKNNLPKSTKLVGFSADTFEPQAGDFKTLFNENGFDYSMLPAELVQKAKKNKETVHSSDGYHWNERGHELIANGLIEFMIE